MGQRKTQNKDNIWDKEKHRTRIICGIKKSIEQGQYVGQRKAQNKDNMWDKEKLGTAL